MKMKMSKVEKFEAVRGVLVSLEGTEAAVEFIDAEIEAVLKRNANRGLTKTQKENIVIKENMVEVLAETGATDATSLAQVMSLNVQKVSALLKQLKDEGLVTRTEGKGKEKTTFAVAE